MFLRNELFYTAKTGDVDKLNDWLNQGADLKIQNDSKETLLHVAARFGHANMVRQLLRYKADTKASDCGRTPLHIAAQYGHIDIIRQLLEHEAYIEARTHYGNRTPLHMACLSNQPHAVKLLLASGANINAKDRDGDTALKIASNAHNQQIMKLFSTREANIVDTKLVVDNSKTGERKISSQNQPMPYSHNRLQLVEQLLLFLYSGSEIPLHVACTHGDRETMKLLLDEKGADIEVKDYRGRTALHLACSRKDFNVVELLLTKGANIEAKDLYHERPLHVACYFASPHEDHKIVKLLLEKGADINAADSRGRTPLYLACKKNQSSIMKLLWADKRVNVTQLDTECFTNLLPMLQTYEKESPLLTVNLSERFVAGNELIHLAAALKLNPLIQKLVLAVNKFSRTGLYELAKVLKHNTTLQVVDLSLNPIGSRSSFLRWGGVQYLFSALGSNTHLTQLSLEGCLLDINDLNCIIDFLKERTHETLERIDFGVTPDAVTAKLSFEEKGIYLRTKNTIVNTFAFLDFIHKIKKTIPEYKEKEWLALKLKLSSETQVLVSELSMEEKNTLLAHQTTLFFKEYRSHILSKQDELATKDNYLDVVDINALAILFMEYADILSKSKAPVLAPWISDIQAIIDSVRLSHLAKQAVKYDEEFSSSSIDEEDPTKIFSQSFYNRMAALHGVALSVLSGHIKHEIMTPIEHVALAIKNIISGLSGFGKMAEGVVKFLDIAGTEAIRIVKQAELEGAVARVASIIVDSPLGEYGIDKLKDEVIRKIHGLTEEDKLQNLVNCFSGNAGYESKIRSIGHAIFHHYHEQIEKLSSEEAEKWGRYAFLHVADLLMSGVLLRSPKKSKETMPLEVVPTTKAVPLKADLLMEKVILWLSYAPIRNHIHRTKEILEKDEKESLKNCFMRPEIKFYKDKESKKNKSKTCTFRMMVQDKNGFVISQDKSYPPRWATKKEVDSLSHCFNTQNDDNQYQYGLIDAAEHCQLIFDHKKLESELEVGLKRDIVHFETKLSSYESIYKTTQANKKGIKIVQEQAEISNKKQEIVICEIKTIHEMETNALREQIAKRDEQIAKHEEQNVKRDEQIANMQKQIEILMKNSKSSSNENDIKDCDQSETYFPEPDTEIEIAIQIDDTENLLLNRRVLGL